MQGKNREKLIRLVKEIVDEHYVPQSHRGSLTDIYRRVVSKTYPMSMVTFFRMIERAIADDGYVGNGANRVYRNAKGKGKED